MEADFRSRLRRLRREEGGAPPAEAAPVGSDREAGAPAPDPAGASALSHTLRRRAERTGRAPEPIATERARAELGLGDPADLTIQSSDRGELLARVRRFAREHRHGDFSLSEVRAARGADFELLTGHAQLAELDLERALYLDTETTGLAGGAGTYVFLVGLGSFEGSEFQLWQGFLRHPAEERALLAECAERIAASAGLVSFFGKSFDRHRLEDRMRVHGLSPPFARVPHLDLYHPLRRLYRGAYADTRLQTLERELCAVARADDMPGSLAPAAWFDYQAGRPHRLEGVFRHNQDDVLSLVTLAAHLGRASLGVRADGATLAGDPAARTLGLARSLVQARRREEAQAQLERFLAEAHRNSSVAAELGLRSLWAELQARRITRRHPLRDPRHGR